MQVTQHLNQILVYAHDEAERLWSAHVEPEHLLLAIMRLGEGSAYEILLRASFRPEEAKAQAEKILLDHFGGYTIQEANGGWIDDDGTEYREYTLVIYLSDTDLDSVHALCDELLKTFNQSSVLIQSNQTRTEFYGG